MKKNLLTLLIISMGLFYPSAQAMNSARLVKTGTKLFLTQFIGTTTGTITSVALAIVANVALQAIEKVTTLIILPIGKGIIIRAGRYGTTLLKNGVSRLPWYDEPEERTP